MASAYPGGIDNLAINKTNLTDQATDHPNHHNDLADAINKIENELGTNPSGTSFTTVKDRLAQPSRIITLNNVSGNVAIDLQDNQNTLVIASVSGNVTGWTVSNFTQVGQYWELRIKQNGGPFIIGLPGGQWAGGVDGAVTNLANAIDRFAYQYVGGLNIDCWTLGKNFA